MNAQVKTKRTLKEFIALAQQVHGQKYGYSAAIYINSPTPLQILCPEHGAFMQSPSNHLAGKGCRKCASKAAGDKYRKSGDDFVEESRNVHGDRYDYSDCDYKTARLKVTIKCKVHGRFEQVPYAHLTGAGCPICGKKAIALTHSTSRREFGEQGIVKYGEKFDYSKVEYVNAWTPVLIGCPSHGEFTQTPAAHLHNTTYGCPQCASDDAGNRGRGPRGPRPQDRSNTAEFIERALAKHKGKYDYSLVEYTASKEKVTIVCKVHGPFKQDATGHLSGSGCPKCRYENNSASQRQSVESFLARARAVHGNKYDYSKVEYKTARLPVTIICPVHGEFQQPPGGHLNQGCRKCADDDLPGAYSITVLSRDPVLANRPAILYYLLFESNTGERFFKVGITLKSIKQRFAGYGAAGYTYTVLGEKKLTLIDAFKVEQTLVNTHVKANHYSPLRGNRELSTKFGGRKECFSVALPECLVNLFDCPDS
jgi:ssDNA-binding Zn-finger/Zn-ribbon topoisomerase 1